MRSVGRDNVRVQYDAYHMQRMEGNLMPTIAEHLDLIGHIQIADSPGRGEPGTGEIDYEYLLPKIDELGYAGWVGLEYKPTRADGRVAGLDGDGCMIGFIGLGVMGEPMARNLVAAGFDVAVYNRTPKSVDGRLDRRLRCARPRTPTS